MFKEILGRNIIFWILLGLGVAGSVNWRLCTIERGRYLLGIYYNGFYKNAADGLVYRDYLKTHKITSEFIDENI